MKKILLLSAVTLFFTVSIYAQPGAEGVKKEKKEERKELRKLNGNVVSEASKQEFIMDFGKIPGIAWKRSANFDEATFKKGGKVTTAFFDDQSKLVGTTSVASFAKLPVRAQEFINKKYKGYKIGDVIFFDDNEANETDMMLFNQQFDDVDSYFVKLKKGDKVIVVEVTAGGDVSYFTKM